MFAEDGGFDAYMKQLETISGRSIQSFPDMLTALEQEDLRELLTFEKSCKKGSTGSENSCKKGTNNF